MSVSLTHATGNKFSESVKKATLHFSFGGKWPLTGYDGLRYWVYTAHDDEDRGLFRNNTTWGISFDQLPKHWVMNPRLAMPRLLGLNSHNEYLADDVETPILNEDGLAVIPRYIGETENKNQFDIAFISTPEESVEPLLLGVNLEIFDEQDHLFRTVMRSTLLGPKLV
jgi:hypothetical protein